MRPFIAIAALVALAGLSTQAVAQSRYGPRPTARVEETREATVDLPPQAMLGWPGKTAPAPIIAPQPQEAPQPSLPRHLYDTPAAPGPQAAIAPASAPAPVETALLGGPPAPRPAPTSPSATGPRFYSVYREYGVAPDAIAQAPAARSGQETTLRELPSTPSLAGQDDTQYQPYRPNAEAASRRTF